MYKIVILIAGLTSLAVTTSADSIISQGGISNKTCSVQKIYVTDFGTDPRHINFRLGLEKWLSKKKFTVATRSEDADAVLTGAVSTSSGSKYSYLSFKNAELKLANGEIVWHGNFDFRTKNAFGWLGRGHIENGAKRISENVRAACK